MTEARASVIFHIRSFERTHVRLLHRLWREDSGQDLIEYGLIIALVVVASIALFPQIAAKMGTAFSNRGSNVQSIWIPWCPGTTTTCY